MNKPRNTKKSPGLTSGSTRDVVRSCAGTDAPDDTPISSIPGLSPDDLGGCINDSIPLRGRQRFKAGEISSSDTLGDVINATDVRKLRVP